MKKFDPTQATFFMHIPKAAGSSIDEAILNALHPKMVVRGLDTSLLNPSAKLDLKNQNSFSNIAFAGPAADYISGHISMSSSRAFFPTSQAITFMRNPFSRIISHWLYFRSLSRFNIEDENDREIVQLACKPLEVFLSNAVLAHQVDNLVTRMLVCPHVSIANGNFISPSLDDQLLGLAKSALEEFSYVDVIEGPGVFESFSQWLGTPVQVERRNVTAQIPGYLRGNLEEHLTQRAWKLLETNSRLDLELWHLASATRGRNRPESEELLRYSLAATLLNHSRLMAGVEPASRT